VPVVAVTGGSGRIGQAVLRELRQHGYTTWNLDESPDGGLSDRFTRGNILDRGTVAKWLAGADALVHLAAIPAPGIASDDWMTTINVLGTYRVLEEAIAAGITRFAVASSMSALGLAWGRRFPLQYLPLDEDHPLTPEDAYGASKIINEVHAAMFARRTGASIALLRFPMVVDDGNFEPFRTRLKADPEMGARHLWSYVDVADAARACRLALEHPHPGAEAYYVTAADHLAGDDIDALLATYYPGVARRPDFRRDASLVTCAKATAAFGYQPRPRG
jgi:nucleoside-diphosphate-sugar epimerase